MPKAKMSDREKSEKAFYRAYARAKVDLDLVYDQDVADHIKMNHSAYYKRRRDLYSGFGFDEAVKFATALKLSAGEICAIFGVKWEQSNDNNNWR